MSKIPENVGSEYAPSLTMIQRGKVRDTYALPNTEIIILPVTTDRVSIFDFVLPAEVPQKGEILNAMNTFWTLQLYEFQQDQIAFGKGIVNYLPPELRGDINLQRRAMVIKKLDMIPIEAIVRNYITGSGWNAYLKTAPSHKVCGHSLPSGLRDGDRLATPVFTPTNKASEGHDEHLDIEEVRKNFGDTIEHLSLKIFSAASQIALERGIILADTKLEFGISSLGTLMLGDERFTPDSSRFWLLKDWEASRIKGTSPISFDKQFVREWGKKHGIDKRNPQLKEDVEYVRGLTVPTEVLLATRQIYRYIFYLLTGVKLETFQAEGMGIPTHHLPVEIVLGSESDINQAGQGLDALWRMGVPFRVHVISCHRNPEELRQYAESGTLDNATIIAGAGKAAALPGILQSWLRHFGKGYIPVLGVAFSGSSEAANNVAQLSIEQLPGNPVVLNEKTGKAYFGIEGFLQACTDAATKKFFIPESKTKPPRLSINFSGC